MVDVNDGVTGDDDNTAEKGGAGEEGETIVRKAFDRGDNGVVLVDNVERENNEFSGVFELF